MKTVNTSAANPYETATNANTTEEIILTDEQKAAVIKEVAGSPNLIQEVVNNGKLKAVKANGRKLDWVNVACAGAIGAIMSASDMVINNALNADVNGEDAPQYSALDILGVSSVSGLVAAGLRAGMDYVPQVRYHQGISLVTTSLTANVAYVASVFVRDAALGMIKGNATVTVDVEALAD
jgi:hypothetical protein